MKLKLDVMKRMELKVYTERSLKLKLNTVDIPVNEIETEKHENWECSDIQESQKEYRLKTLKNDLRALKYCRYWLETYVSASILPKDDGDLKKLFLENLDSLRTIRNHVNLIYGYWRSLHNYHKKCKGIHNKTYRFRENSKLDLNNIRYMFKASFIHICNNALMHMCYKVMRIGA